MNRCCKILTPLRKPIVCAAWAAFFIYWVHRFLVAYDWSFVVPIVFRCVIIASGGCCVALGWWLRGRWTQPPPVADTIPTLARAGHMGFVGVYADSQSGFEWEIAASGYCITWHDGRRDRRVQGSVDKDGQLEVVFNERHSSKRGTLRGDGSISWSNGTVWRRR